MRYIDYIIGRLSGEFSPADPLAYRNRTQQGLNQSVVSYEHENLSSLPGTSDAQSDKGRWKTSIKKDAGNFGYSNIGRHDAGGPTSYKQANGQDRGWRKSDMVGFPMTSPRLAEVKNILMSFSAPGKDPPPFVQQTLVNLSSLILERGGDDSFLEQPLKKLRKVVGLNSVFDVLGGLLNPAGRQTETGSESPIQEQTRFHTPSIKNLTQDAINDLEQIRDLLTPSHPPEFVQNKLKELIMSYYRTGDLDIFKRALVDCLNRRPG